MTVCKVRWFVTIDPDVDVDFTAGRLARFIDDCLSDPAGWRSRGYRFQRVTAPAGNAVRRDASTGHAAPCEVPVWVRLSLPATIARGCGFGDRSCADLSDRVVYLNAQRWSEGSTETPEMTLGEYRKAVVVHEFGHMLGYHHIPCQQAGHEGDVMQEFTRLGWGGCLPTTRPTAIRSRQPPRSTRVGRI